MITTFIKRVSGLWIMILLPALSYAGAPSGHYENHFDRQHGVWDLTGSYDETELGLSNQYSIVQDDKGKISGQGRMTGTDEGIYIELDTRYSGSIKSIGEITRAVLKEKLIGTATDGYQVAKIKGKITYTYDIDKLNNRLIGTAKGKICAEGAGEKACAPVDDAAQTDLPEEAQGTWDLVLDIQSADGRKLTGAAAAILANGRTEPLTLKGKYNAQTDLAKLGLKGSGGKSTIQAQEILGQLIFQSLKGKLLGQTVTQ